jgi:hypothetical protein
VSPPLSGYPGQNGKKPPGFWAVATLLSISAVSGVGGPLLIRDKVVELGVKMAAVERVIDRIDAGISAAQVEKIEALIVKRVKAEALR